PDVSPGELARLIHVHPSTLTGVLQRLLSRGLLKRESVASDRRRAVLRLTGKGARTNQPQAGTVEAAGRLAPAELRPAERAAAERALNVLAERLVTPPARTRQN